MKLKVQEMRDKQKQKNLEGFGSVIIDEDPQKNLEGFGSIIFDEDPQVVIADKRRESM